MTEGSTPSSPTPDEAMVAELKRLQPSETPGTWYEAMRRALPRLLEIAAERDRAWAFTRELQTQLGRLAISVGKKDDSIKALKREVEELRKRETNLKYAVDARLNDRLCEMKEGYDDSIVGFNEAWNVVSETFAQRFPLLPNARLMRAALEYFVAECRDQEQFSEVRGWAIACKVKAMEALALPSPPAAEGEGK